MHFLTGKSHIDAKTLKPDVLFCCGGSSHCIRFECFNLSPATLLLEEDFKQAMEVPDDAPEDLPNEPVKAEEEAEATAATATNNKDDSSHPSFTVDQARHRLETTLQHSVHNNAEDSKDALLFDSIQLVLKDHDQLKDKVGKLKSLLGRSAKAQRESKVEMDATQKRLDQALQEIQLLNKKVEKLSNRPSPMVRRN